MMIILGRINALVLAVTVSAGSVLISAPAFADVAQCTSNSNVGHVHRQLTRAIEHLSHDQSDYGGKKQQAIDDMKSARSQLVKAERYAISHDGDNPACFAPTGPIGGAAIAWGDRGQGSSDQDVWGVRNWVENLLAQLNSDARDYGGHKAKAVARLQNAQASLLAAENYAQSQGH